MKQTKWKTVSGIWGPQQLHELNELNGRPFNSFNSCNALNELNKLHGKQFLESGDPRN
jgi:hypothetical protein